MANDRTGGSRSWEPGKQDGNYQYYNDAPSPPQMGLLDYIFKNSANQKLAQYENEYNYWMWQQENRYNNPENTMDRYRDAGINPNIIAGDVGGGNASPGKPAASAEWNPNFNPLGILDKYVDLRAKSAQIRNIEAQTDYTKQRAFTEDLGRGLISSNIDVKTAEAIDKWNETHLKWTGGENAPGRLKYLAEFDKVAQQAEHEIYKKQITEEMAKYLKLNAAAKWIPLITAFMRGF